MSGTYNISNNFCNRALEDVYSFYIMRGLPRSKSFEAFTECSYTHVPSIGEDAAYYALFGEECAEYVEEIFNLLVSNIKNETGDELFQYIEAISCLQTILSTALWTYKININLRLENFTRDFDRLDVECERLRLIKAIKSSKSDF